MMRCEHLEYWDNGQLFEAVKYYLNDVQVLTVITPKGKPNVAERE